MKRILGFLILLLLVIGMEGCSFENFAANTLDKIDNAIKMEKEQKERIKEAKIKNFEYLSSNGFILTDISGTYRDPLNNRPYKIHVTEKYIPGTAYNNSNSYNKYPYEVNCHGNVCDIDLNIYYKLSKGIYRNQSITFSLVKQGNYWMIVYTDPSNEDVKTYKIGYLDRGDSSYVHLKTSIYNISFDIERIR